MGDVTDQLFLLNGDRCDSDLTPLTRFYLKVFVLLAVLLSTVLLRAVLGTDFLFVQCILPSFTLCETLKVWQLSEPQAFREHGQSDRLLSSPILQRELLSLLHVQQPPF
ncbi:MAG: hypothetical protein WCH75_15605 [Candidatus Binatia bacterium]